jgi:hypothetical protein
MINAWSTEGARLLDVHKAPGLVLVPFSNSAPVQHIWELVEPG